MRQSFNTEALVLKRSNIGEADRIVTLLTKEQGKVAAIAKGIRKITSSKRAALEPGSYINCSLLHTKSLPILTQATLLQDGGGLSGNLRTVRQLVQVLEIVDTVFVEEEIDPSLFDLVIDIRNNVVQQKVPAKVIRQKLEQLLEELGYKDPNSAKYPTILEYVSNIADKHMKSWEYLKVD